MANTNTPVLTIDEDEDLKQTAAKSDALVKAAKPAKAKKNDPMVIAVPQKKEEHKEPMCTVTIPALPGSGSEGIKVDQYEHVTIANEQKEEVWKVLRGEPVQVPYRVYIQLKNRYPKL